MIEVFSHTAYYPKSVWEFLGAQCRGDILGSKKKEEKNMLKKLEKHGQIFKELWVTSGAPIMLGECSRKRR